MEDDSNLTVNHCLETARLRAARAALICYIRWGALAITLVLLAVLLAKRTADWPLIIGVIVLTLLILTTVGRLQTKPYSRKYCVANLITSDTHDDQDGLVYIQNHHGDFCYVEDSQIARQLVTDGLKNDQLSLTTLFLPATQYLEVIDQKNRWHASICCRRMIANGSRNHHEFAQFLNQNWQDNLSVTNLIEQSARQQLNQLLERSNCLKTSEIGDLMEQFLKEARFQDLMEHTTGYRIHRISIAGKEDPVAASTR